MQALSFQRQCIQHLSLGVFICGLGLAGLFSGSSSHVRADDSWRNLPLIKDGKVAPEWVHIGWGGFTVVEDSLRTECVAEGMGLLLYKAEPLGDCQIRIVYRAKDAKSNAGVFVRIDPKILEKLDEKPPAVRRDSNGELAEGALEQLQAASEKEQGPWYAVHHGFEIQICDAADPIHRTGAIYSLAEAEVLPKAPAEHWRTMIVTLRGTRILVEVDGKQVTEFDSANIDRGGSREWYEPKRQPTRPPTGYIGLQNHDPGDVVYLKEVSVRPLTTKQ